MPADALSGYSVLVTRPAESSENLAELISTHGGVPLEFPVIKIKLQAEQLPMQTAAAHMGDVDLAIFVSVHAARSFSTAMGQLGSHVPGKLKIAAIGPTTAIELQSHGYRVDFLPRDAASSEGLIKTLGQSDLVGQRVVIFRGQSGRQVLSQYLLGVGAQVSEIESYRRVTNPEPLDQVLENWQENTHRLLVLTSVDIMQRLLDKVPAKLHTYMLSSGVAVLSQRIAVAAAASGFCGKIQVANNADDQGLLEALIECVQDDHI
ncbi:MAG: uroporphyrinogen-III synthase [bacterium]